MCIRWLQYYGYRSGDSCGRSFQQQELFRLGMACAFMSTVSGMYLYEKRYSLYRHTLFLLLMKGKALVCASAALQCVKQRFKKYEGQNAQLFLCLVFKGIASYALECAVHIEVLLCRCLKVGDATLGCAPLLGLLLCHLHFGKDRNSHPCCYRDRKYQTLVQEHRSRLEKLLRRQNAHHPAPTFIHVHLVAQDHKGEVVWVGWACLRISVKLTSNA
jgi:hypothetical protein